MSRSSLWALIGNRSGVLIALFLAGAALWAFLEVTDEVLEGETRELDQAVLLALRVPTDHSTPVGPVWLPEVARDITSLGGTTVLAIVTLAATGFLVLVRRHRAAIFVVVSIVGGSLLSVALKWGFERPRPDLVPHAVQVYSSSFPSGHAMLSAITYLTLGALLAQVSPRRSVRAYLLGWAVLLTLVIGVSRVYLGVHWPTDVLAGWCVGAAWALLCAVVEAWLQRRGAIELKSAI